MSLIIMTRPKKLIFVVNYNDKIKKIREILV